MKRIYPDIFPIFAIYFHLLLKLFKATSKPQKCPNKRKNFKAIMSFPKQIKYKI